MTYFLTPEFHRQLWLKCEPAKLVAAPLSLLFLWGISVGGAGLDLPTGAVLRMGALYAFIAVVLVWGNYEASHVMEEEIQQRTWDQQRLSSVSPLGLAFGKLFGGTSYVWYVGLMCFVVYFSSFAYPQRSLYYAAYFMIASGLIGQLAAFILSLSAFTSRAQRGAPPGTGPAKFAFFHGALISLFLNEVFFRRAIDAHMKAGLWRDFISDIPWYNHPYDGFVFRALEISFMLFWGLVGAYRMVRKELAFRMWPWVWMIFLPMLSVCWAGFYANGGVSETYYAEMGGDPRAIAWIKPLVCAYAVSLFFGYVRMLTESPDHQLYSRLWAALKARRWGVAFENTPLWLATLPYVLIFGMALLIACGMARPVRLSDYAPAAIGALIFAVRDGFIVHAMHRLMKRYAAFGIPLYFASAYVLIPMIYLGISGQKGVRLNSAWRSQSSGSWQEMFYPQQSGDWGTTLLFPLLQALLAALFFIRFALKHSPYKNLKATT